MKIKSVRRVNGAPVDFGNLDADIRKRLGKRVIVCKYWAAGCCKNDNCKFWHGGVAPRNLDYLSVKQSFAPKKWCRDLNAPQKKVATFTRNVPSKVKANTPLKPDTTHQARDRVVKRLMLVNSQKKNAPAVISCEETTGPNSRVDTVHEKVDSIKTTLNGHVDVIPSKVGRVCEQWIQGNCVDGAQCTSLHSWFRGDGLTRMALLQGHEKAITGMSLPSGSDKLYSSSTDGTLRSWNCHTGQCTDVINLDGEIGSLISVGPWLFVGIPNSISAKNTETSAEYVLRGLVGQVHSVVVVNDVIFAGAQDGAIFAWKASSECNILKPSATLFGHAKAVVSIFVGGNHLYSGSLDHTIKVWDLETLECLQTLSGHSDAVTSLLCLDQFLISSSLDQTIKVWAVNGDGYYGVNYTHKEDQGIHTLAGMNDFESKPLLLCACSDNSVRIYELPSFCDRGRLFTRDVVQKIQIGPSGIFFTGDESGSIAVWKLLET